ncbi:MAG: 16S rRNA (guanine(527)-N(7))-methyltransferase RsmG [Parasporobacterium sp.]|nr:16S rRNA (guanine(527)-N(7))-methyltransferase RsmG [Parasporobacterium sp.]
MDFTLLKDFLTESGITLKEGAFSQLETFYGFLTEKNKVMNLTAITEEKDVMIKHYIDSLSGAALIKELAGETFSLIDVGCGAGFPGIPLKTAFPEAEFILLDSLNKRINFVNEAASLLGLKNLTGVAARAEDFAAGENRESFDICVSRAVADAKVLLEYCLPFVKVGGCCVLYKSDYKEEMSQASKALEILGGEISDVKSLTLPDGSLRSLVIIKKVSPTPSKYPRRAGKPSKSPIQ